MNAPTSGWVRRGSTVNLGGILDLVRAAGSVDYLSTYVQYGASASRRRNAFIWSKLWSTCDSARLSGAQKLRRAGGCHRAYTSAHIKAVDESRGTNCQVGKFFRDDKLAFFAVPVAALFVFVAFCFFAKKCKKMLKNMRSFKLSIASFVSLHKTGRVLSTPWPTLIGCFRD